MTSRILNTLAFAVLGSACATVSSAHADSFLERGVGSWRGTGWLMAKADGPREAVRCRMKTVLEKQGKRLTLSGRCAGGGRARALRGYFESLGGGRYAGRWPDPENASALVSVRARRSGNTLRVTWRSAIRNSDRSIAYSMNWTVSERRITLTTAQGAGGRGGKARIEFTR